MTPRQSQVEMLRNAMARFMPGYREKIRATKDMSRKEMLEAFNEFHGPPGDHEEMTDYMLRAELMLAIRDDFFIPTRDWHYYPDYEQ